MIHEVGGVEVEACGCVVILFTQFCSLLTCVSRVSLTCLYLIMNLLYVSPRRLQRGHKLDIFALLSRRPMQHNETDATGARIKVHSAFTYSMKAHTDEMIDGLSSSSKRTINQMRKSMAATAGNRWKAGGMRSRRL